MYEHGGPHDQFWVLLVALWLPTWLSYEVLTNSLDSFYKAVSMVFDDKVLMKDEEKERGDWE